MQNLTSRTLTITALRPSCGCTSAFLKGDDTLPFTLSPTQQVSVRVTLDPANLPAGPVDKRVWVYVKGQEVPAAMLEMTGTLLPTVHLAPAALDFGQSRFGSSSALPLSITWNRALLPPGSQCRLVSTTPDVQITPDLAGAAGETVAAQAYHCTLSAQADLGALSGNVEAIVTPPGAGPVIVGAVPVEGAIHGDVVVSPAVVAFGTVTAGQSASQQIILTLDQPVLPMITSASRYVSVQRHSVQVLSAGSASGKGQLLVEITVSDKTPPGPLTTELTVTTRSGQCLRVPVFALVVKP